MKRNHKNRFITVICCIMLILTLTAVLVPVSVPASAAVTTTYSIFLPLSQLGCLGFTYPDRDSDILKLWKSITVTLDTTISFNGLGFSITAPVVLQDAMIDFPFWNASSAHGTLSDTTFVISKEKNDLLKYGTSANISANISFDGYATNCKQGGTNGYNTYDITYSLAESSVGAVDTDENNTTDPVIDEDATTPSEDLFESVTGSVDDEGSLLNYLFGDDDSDDSSLWERTKQAFSDLIAGKELSLLEYILVIFTMIMAIFIAVIFLKIVGFLFKR